MKDLMKRAKWLGSRIETEWAELHEDSYSEFANELSKQYALGNISDSELEELAITAFYDFDLNVLKDYRG